MTRGYKEKDITGMKFGRLTAIKRAGKYKRAVMWMFQCDCGNICYTYKSKVVIGRTRSCGCLRLEHLKEVHEKRWRREISKESGSAA